MKVYFTYPELEYLYRLTGRIMDIATRAGARQDMPTAFFTKKIQSKFTFNANYVSMKKKEMDFLAAILTYRLDSTNATNPLLGEEYGLIRGIRDKLVGRAPPPEEAA